MATKINLELPVLYPKQLDILSECISEKSKAKYICVNGSRQVGKSKLLSCAAIHWCLNKPEQCIMYVTFTDSQVREVQQTVIQMLGDAFGTVVKDYRTQVGNQTIEFVNGSRILFRSSGAEAGLRGFANTHLIIDEGAFIKEDVVNTVLLPTISVKGRYGKVLIASTPKGNNWFFKWYNQGEAGNERYKSFRLHYSENPYRDDKFIEDMRTNIPLELYQQEFECTFCDSTGVFQNTDSIATFSGQTAFQHGNSYYQAWDIAFKNDYTVGITLNQKGQMVDMVRVRDVNIITLGNLIGDTMKKWSPRRTMIEANNQGLPVIQFVRSLGLRNITEFYQTENSKSDIINQLIASVSKQEIELLDNPIVKSEFKAFCATLTRTGKVQFESSFGHDDIVMATAMALECKSKYFYTRGFVFDS